MQVECNGLQKECSVLRSDKQDMVNKHQKEIISLQSECASLRAEKEDLLKTHQKVCSEKEGMLQKQQQLEKDLVRSVLCNITMSSAQLHPHLGCPSISFAFCCTVQNTFLSL